MFRTQLYRARQARRFFFLLPAILLSYPALGQARKDLTKLIVEIRAPQLSTSSKMKVLMDPKTCGLERAAQTMVIGDKQALANTLVWLEGSGLPSWNSKNLSTELTIKDCEFTPRILVVPTGGSVSIRNDDKILHNLRTRGKLNPPIHRPLPSILRETVLKFERAEIVPILCDLHPWEVAYLIVSPHPYYAATDIKGRATFPKLVPGQFTIQLWHEVLGQRTLPTFEAKGGEEIISSSGDSSNLPQRIVVWLAVVFGRAT